jgi:tripartite ATP-independent transporter DctM subunit
MIPTPEPLLATILLIGVTFLLFILGLPVTFSLGATATIFALLFFEPSRWYQIVTSMYGAVNNDILIAIPLFVFMGLLIIHTRMAQDLYDALYKWAGSVRGSLAMGTEVIGSIFGAMCGDAAATTATIGGIAVPEMLRRGYHKDLVVGSVGSAGLLGILIPPTVEGIIFCVVTGMSVGRLYFALIFPGFLLALLYVVYIGVRCYLQPAYAPGASSGTTVSWNEKLSALKAVILPVLIVLAILGGIYAGVVTPTEAAGVGAFLVIVAALVRKGLTGKRLGKAALEAFQLSAMIVWIVMAITAFSNVYHAMGASALVSEAASTISENLGGFAVILLMQLSIFIFGMLMDDVAMIMVTAPIYMPVVVSLGYDPVWFAVIFLVNMQCAWLTPPYGFSLFIMRAILPKNISTTDMYRGVLPFIGLQIVALVIVMLVPAIALWLPSRVIG